MLVREVKAYIVCSKCDCGVEYAAIAIRHKLEDVYGACLKPNLGKCEHCKTGDKTIRDIECKIINSAKIEYKIKWQCAKCRMQWVQSEYLHKGEPAVMDRVRFGVKCPNLYCSSQEKKMMGMLSFRPKREVDIRKV